MRTIRIRRNERGYGKYTTEVVKKQDGNRACIYAVFSKPSGDVERVDGETSIVRIENHNLDIKMVLRAKFPPWNDGEIDVERIERECVEMFE